MSEAKLHKSKKIKILLVTLLCVIISFFVIIMPIVSIRVYNDNFGERYETQKWRAYSISDFDKLQCKEIGFSSNKGQTLAGYKYKKNIERPKGVIVIAHGLGGGGHNTYMDIADYFTSNDYYVFAYDATGTDKSEGECVGGLPQGAIDLDYALQYVKSDDEYKDLPIMLFGHSWGGYSVGNVLNFHPDVTSAVIVAGFDCSTDLIKQQGEIIAGSAINLLMPYITLYERFKFGKYAKCSVLDGFKNSNANVMVIHSKNDTTVKYENGYQKFYDSYKDNERFTFISFENRDHDYIYNSAASSAYRDQINNDYKNYIKANGGENNPSIKDEFIEKNLDKKQYFELDGDLMSKILKFYNDSCL